MILRRSRRLLAFLAVVAVLLTAQRYSKKGESASLFSHAGEGSGRDAYDLLLLGQDEAAELTDVVILVHVDVEAGRMCLAQIPRDTYLRYTNRSYKKINGAVKTAGGAVALCEVLERALPVTIDGYVLLDLACVRDAVDLLGGVEVDVPCDMDYEDPTQGLSIHLKKGKALLSGEEAVHFVRYRAGYVRGDLGRVDAQKLFLAAFLEAATHVDMGDLPRLAALIVRSVDTDLPLDLVLSLLLAARNIPADSITLLTLPGEEMRSAKSGAWYYVLSRAGTAEVMETQFGVAGAGACIDPAHLFSDASRADFEAIYCKYVPPVYHTASGIRQEGIAPETVDGA